MMNDEHNSLDELKRVDHLIFVTLKYTRTADIIKNVINRLVLALDYQSEEFLHQIVKKGKLDSVPTVALLRVKKLEELFKKDKEIKDMVDFYVLLRKIDKSEYTSQEEYRKNVALISDNIMVNIEVLKSYADKTKKYINYVKSLM
ncbi:MAG: hypothetical protein ABIF40_01945 [archaeon]